MFASKDSLLTRPSGYNIARSVRLRSSASAYFNRTPSSTTNQQKWTFSTWMKLGGSISGNTAIFVAGTTGSSFCAIAIDGNNNFSVFWYVGASIIANIGTSAKLRDPSAWYHIVVTIDTTQATAANRIIVYINGVQQTSLLSTTYPSQNYNGLVNSNIAHYVGQFGSAGYNNFDGYLTEINFIDGQALTPSSFGETDSITGVWKPKAYSGTYGTNGFELNFSDNSNNTAATIGKDYSGNGNNWTPNNISVTAGVTYDSMVDSPTVGATSSNYAVLNPLSNGYGTTATISITDGNLNFSDATSTTKTCISSMTASSGKWYVEMTCSSSSGTYSIGLLDKPTNNESWYRNNGAYSASFGGGGTTGYSSWTTGDVIGIAWDADAGKIWFSKNNTWQSGSPSAGTSPTNTFTAGLSLFPDVYTDNSAGTKSGSFNFGQRPFTYTPPTGFVALNTYNLPTSTITNGAAYMAATLYTGNGSTQTISNAVNGVSFQPDFVWIKERSSTSSNNVYDVIRGVTNYLLPNTTGAEATEATSLTAFNSNGFSLGGAGFTNENTQTNVAWNWKANGAGVSNTNGSITSTVSAGATQGFSIATYTSQASGTATVGHGLGVAPSMIIIKPRTGTLNWYIYHASLGAGNYILFTTAATVASANLWNSTSPTSSVFTLGTDWNGSISSVAYCFAAVAGYSAFGTYSSNASSDGPFVFLGFKPRWIMIKKSSGSTNANAGWYMFDTSRATYNAVGPYLNANLPDMEGSFTALDILSNGFKIRVVDISINGSTAGDNYIYAAFAENPFKNALAR